MQKILILGVLGGAFLGYAAWVPHAAAQGASTDTTVLSRFSEEVVITTSLIEQERRESPASADVVTRAEIEARQATSVAELLATLPGMMVVEQGVPGQVTSLFTRGTESDHTLVLWNGIELNNPYFGGFNWAFLPTEGVERVEVARGPFSAQYGSDAVGGVVHVLSGDERGLTLAVEGGADSYLRGAIGAGGSVGDVRLDLSGSVREGDSEFANGFFDSQDVFARAEWRGDQGLAGVVARYNDSETGIPFSGGAPSLTRMIAWEAFEVAVPFSWNRPQWSVSGQASLVETDSAFRDPADAFGFTRSDTESRSSKVRVAATRTLSDTAWIGLGADYEELSVDDESVFGINLDDASQETNGAFAQFYWGGERVSVDASVRYDDNDAFGSATSPRVGVSVRLSDALRLRGQYGEAFRSPSLGELFFPFSGNASLAPEESESFELAIEYAKGRWVAGVTAFENDLENLIDFDFVTFTNINVGRARSEGFELSAAYRGEGFSVNANFTSLEAEDRLARLPLLRRAEETANLVATVTPGSLSVNAVIRYVGDRPDFDPVTFSRATNPSYLTADLAVSYSGLGSGTWGQLVPYARVENLGDEEYEPALGFPAQGRTLIGGLRMSF